MPKYKHKPTPELRERIALRIAAGAYRHVAAEAEGVPAQVLERWLSFGSRPRPKRAYAEVLAAVRTAEAQARADAEARLFIENPSTWLKSGPGRETGERPGWTGVKRPKEQAEDATRNALADPAWQALFATIQQALAEFPQARAAVARALRPAEPARPARPLAPGPDARPAEPASPG